MLTVTLESWCMAEYHTWSMRNRLGSIWPMSPLSRGSDRHSSGILWGRRGKSTQLDLLVEKVFGAVKPPQKQRQKTWSANGAF